MQTRCPCVTLAIHHKAGALLLIIHEVQWIITSLVLLTNFSKYVHDRVKEIYIRVCVCVCVCTHARMCTRSIFLPVNTWTWIYLHYRYEIQEMTQVFGSTLSLSPSFSLQIKWNLVSGNTNPNRFYLQEFWWVKTILETYGWRYWIIIHERVGKERDEMRFKTKPRQNPKGDQLGTWDFRDNVWDTHTHTHTYI